jgi:hypothetical protein
MYNHTYHTHVVHGHNMHALVRHSDSVLKGMKSCKVECAHVCKPALQPADGERKWPTSCITDSGESKPHKAKIMLLQAPNKGMRDGPRTKRLRVSEPDAT